MPLRLHRPGGFFLPSFGESVHASVHRVVVGSERSSLARASSAFALDDARVCEPPTGAWWCEPGADHVAVGNFELSLQKWDARLMNFVV